MECNNAARETDYFTDQSYEINLMASKNAPVRRIRSNISTAARDCLFMTSRNSKKTFLA